MDEAGQKRAIEWLRDWTKWLIGIDFAAVAGCVLLLENANGATLITPFLLLAITSFAISIICSVFLVRQLAHIAEVLPLSDRAGNPTTIFGHQGLLGITVRTLATLQLSFLVMGGVLFLVWVVIGSLTP